MPSFAVLCPDCGAALSILHDEASIEPQPEDRLVCPAHGDVGSYGEFKPHIEKAGIEEAVRRLNEILRGGE